MSWSRKGLLAMVIAAMLLVPSPQTSVLAQDERVEPRAIVVVPADLPPIFRVDPAETGDRSLDGKGVGFAVSLRREQGVQAGTDGPLAVSQIVYRIDQDLSPAEFYAELRDRIMAERHMELFPGGDNSASSTHLINRSDAEFVEEDTYGVGRVRDNMILFTLVSGLAPSTSIQSAIRLSNLSMEKYDRVRAAGSAQALVDRLQTTPFTTDELPAGFAAGPMFRSPLSQRAGDHGALAEIDFQVQGPNRENLITFIVYATEADGRNAFDDAPDRATARGSQLVQPEGFPHPVFCATRSGEIGGEQLGATSCLALLGNVEVNAFTVLEDQETGNMEHSLELMTAGIKHLEKVRQTLTSEE